MASNTINSKIKLDGEKTFAQALREIAQEAKLLDSELRATTSSIDKNADAQSKAQSQADALNKRIEGQRKVVERLKAVMEDSIKQNTENSEVTKKARIAYNDAVTALNNLESQYDDASDAAKNMGNSTEKSSTQSSRASSAFKTAGNAIASVAKGIGASAAAITTAAAGIATAAGVALGKLVKESVNAFGELEQNLGGSEAVFGDYAKSVQSLGEDAYRTMGVTQSEYLATANKMGALFQGSGLDIKRSMDLSTQAMQRATDMASVMGIDVDSALEAVTGAAKGNYTMMDNLGVAMNATTLEAYAVSKGIDTAFSKMTNAEKAELAMQYFFENTAQYAGNFEREATETISGSFGLLEASVQSLVAGMGNADADIGKLTQNVVDAFSAVVSNVSPVVSAVLQSLPTIVEGIGDAILQQGPGIVKAIESVLGTLLKVLTKLMPQLLPIFGSALELLVGAIVQNLPMILETASSIIMTLADGLILYLPQIAEVAINVILSLVNALVQGDTLILLINAALSIIMTLAQGLIDNLPLILSSAMSLIGELLNGLADGIPQLIDMAIELVFAILQGLTDPSALQNMIRGALRLLVELARGLVAAIPEITSRLPEIIASIVKTLIELAPELIVAAIEIIGQLIVGLIGAIPQIVQMIPDIINAIKESFDGFDWSSIGTNIMNGIKNGISNMIGNLISTIKDAASNLLNAAKKALGIASPSKEFAEVGQFIGMGLDEGMTKSLRMAATDMRHELAALPMQASATLTSAAGSGTSRAYNVGNMSFVVNAAEGQDPEAIAHAVERVFLAELRTTEGALA